MLRSRSVVVDDGDRAFGSHLWHCALTLNTFRSVPWLGASRPHHLNLAKSCCLCDWILSSTRFHSAASKVVKSIDSDFLRQIRGWFSTINGHPHPWSRFDHDITESKLRLVHNMHTLYWTWTRRSLRGRYDIVTSYASWLRWHSVRHPWNPWFESRSYSISSSSICFQS